ncbi:MerR family transcriptional regulator [Rhodococcus sp. UNC363MFTsu5.1]|uniref:MerR family transcriptional regulator n=1 Tax=Rhodococcus sp. UNC363MFTsu5.1 TaxID=1449069 RepID=UPI0004890C7F|nr:MerR family transcriptional regulator [Rhodococcus sp. UNC363MFTsu5.1]
MDDDALYSIGDLARRTGLTVKAIRFYADRGIVPPTGRSPAGYRLYDVDAIARLDLVRTLRELGLDLVTIKGVVDRQTSLPEVAAAHAEALAAQIRTLGLRRTVLSVVAKRGSGPEEMRLVHKLAKLSESERRSLIVDFLDHAFGGFDGEPGFEGIMRSMTPELPENPEAEQIEAWVELAELSWDPDFRVVMREIAQDHAEDQRAARAHGGAVGVRREIVAIVRDHAEPMVAAGVDPAAPEANPVVEEVTAQYARLRGGSDDVGLLRRLLSRLEAANDPRRERYLLLLAVVNGWAVPDSSAAALDWFVRALRARLPE